MLNPAPIFIESLQNYYVKWSPKSTLNCLMCYIKVENKYV